MRRLAVLLAACLVFAPASAAADDGLARKLARQMRFSGAHSSAYVMNLTRGETVFAWKHRSPRILASNTKLFTTAAALARYGSEGTLGTEVLGAGALEGDGVWRGDLYLKGGGDPTFGTRRFVKRYYGTGATVEQLASLIDDAGVERVTGRVYGDESRFDRLRGGPDSGYAASIWVGPLSGLSFNRGLGDPRGRTFQTNPPLYAAAQLDAALERRGIAVRRAPRARVAAPGTEVLASVDSPPMGRLIKLTNEPSDNFFAEMLLKGLALQAHGRGTTAGGAKLATGFARRLGSGARLVDGSGLSRGNRASARQVARLLRGMLERDRERYDGAYFESLAMAGSEGTLADRLRRGAAHRRCVGKTGTLSDVSALSGYCEAISGDVYVYSILMNYVSPTGARRLQDAMVRAIAAQRL